MLLHWVQRFVQWSDWSTEFGTGGICLISDKLTTVGHCIHVVQTSNDNVAQGQ